MSDVARRFGYNQTYLSSLFKRETGKPLAGFINEVKVDEAKRLLRATDKPIVEIAVALGFSSQNYFQTVFKRFSGLTPEAYRAKR